MFMIRTVLFCVLLAPLAVLPARAQFTQTSPASASSIPQDHVIQVDALRPMLGGAEKPVIFQVGSHVMFTQAHIPGSLYAGPGSQQAGLELLASRAAKFGKGQLIVLYCGCCPWSRCPNVGPAYAQLASLGYTNVKVLYIADNFGADWVSKGYVVEKGE